MHFTVKARVKTTEREREREREREKEREREREREDRRQGGREGDQGRMKAQAQKNKHPNTLTPRSCAAPVTQEE